MLEIDQVFEMASRQCVSNEASYYEPNERI
jgi:hypothetical protein